MENKILNESTPKEKKTNNKNGKNSLLYIRWLFIVFFICTYFFDPHISFDRFVFHETIAVTVIYNLFVTFYCLIYNRSSGKYRKILHWVIYADVIAASVFVFELGGVNSDVYMIYFFIIGFCVIFNDIIKTLQVGIFCSSLYLIACMVSAGEFNVWKLIMREFFILIAAYGVSLINREVRKYDEMHKRESKLARTDKLTGLANRHYLEQKLKEEIEYSNTTGHPLNILIFDLDNFKRFNDTYGHVWGDKLLTLFADIIRQNTRQADIPIRFGGEEFLILIRDLDVEIAKSVADRIRRQLEKQKIYVGNEDERGVVTVSGGVAQYPRHSSNIKEAIDLADKALYHAKGTGKNKIVSYDEIELADGNDGNIA